MLMTRVSLRRLFPPYHRNLVFVLCGAHILYCAVVLAIHQTFWLLSTQIFPTAYQMFDDTHDRTGPDEFPWDKASRQQLDRYQVRVALSWAVACAAIGISMLCIIPQFCTMEVAEDKEVDLCIRQQAIAQFLAPLFVLVNLLLVVCLITEYMDCPADDRLFHSLFNGAIKEEVYLTSFEDQLDCLSDDDIEGFDVWKCDRIIGRAILNGHWLGPLLIAHFALVLCFVIACLLFNDPEKILREACSLAEDEEGD